MKFDLLNTAIIIFILGFGGYMLYKSINRFAKHKQAKNEYLEGHEKANKAMHNDAALWSLMSIAIIAMAIVGILMEVNGNMDVVTMAAYMFVIFWGTSLLFDVFIRRNIIFDDNGYFYDTEYTKYRSVISVIPHQGLMPRYDVSLTNGKEVSMPRKYGKILEEKAKNKKKKESRKGK
ncbi:hypothetical protein A4S06_07415 [Erysipelotrichaceae bacterium MTC7]|nr:hypothetical protein A4S06_07415 [Erysipelotrichaceae bacterium MTC7]